MRRRPRRNESIQGGQPGGASRAARGGDFGRRSRTMPAQVPAQWKRRPGGARRSCGLKSPAQGVLAQWFFLPAQLCRRILTFLSGA